MAVRLPDLILAAMPIYGRQPAAADFPKIKAVLLIHCAQQYPKINEGWSAYEAALKEAKVRYPPTPIPALLPDYTE